MAGFQPGEVLSQSISFSLITAPTVTTNAATNVTTSGATLNGIINGNGETGVATKFSYGLTTNYGSTAAASPSSVSGSTDTAINATISGLIPGVTYHYRAEGVIGGTTTGGADQTFTIPAASTVSVLGTPAWTNSGATLSNFTVPAGNNRVLVVAASAENVSGATSALDITSVTFNGSAMTLGAKKNDFVLNSSIGYTVDGLYYVALGTSASPTTANIVVTPGSSATVSAIGAVAFQNVDQTTPLNGFQTANSLTSASTLTATSTAGDMVIDLMDNYNAIPVAGTGQTVAVAGPDTLGGALNYAVSLKLGAASVPMAWTSTGGGETQQVLANIKQASAAIAPAVTSNPSNQTVTAGGTATFTAAASGTPTPTVQWQVSTDGGANFSDVSGATSTTLSFTAAGSDGGKKFRAVFTNTSGSATTTAATLTVNPLPIGGATHVAVGNTATATDATAGGTWTSSNPSIGTVGAASGIVSGISAGTFTLTYTLPSGGFASETFTVDPLPTAFTVTGGGSYTMGGAGVAVGLNGSQAGVNYQLFNGAAPSGSAVAGTGAAISFGNQTAAGTYTVVATNATTNATRSMVGSATVTIIPVADLAISVTDGVTTATPGGSVTYTITASNAGPSNVTGATVADTFPASLTATWTAVGAGGGTATASGSGNINDTVNLPAGGSVTYTVTAAISAGATGTLSNTATVSAPGGVTDPTPGNNSATDSDTLAPRADLAITKTDGVTVVNAGGTVTYTITASNAGPSNAPGTTVADTLPASLSNATWTAVGAGGGTATASGSGNINDTVNLPAGGSVTYTVTANISGSASGTLSNTATVSAPSGVTDPTPGNNSATDSDSVNTAPIVANPTSANIAATKVTLGGEVTSDGGLPVTVRGVVYSLTASNADPVIGGNGVTNLTSSGTTGVFTVNVTGLVPNSGYSFKAYATNSIGTTYTGPASTFTTLTAPEIAIEQPAGTDLTAGTASIGFGTVNLGSNVPKTFTIKNSGSAVLNITSVSTTGGQAGDFIVNTGGMLNNVPITNGQTTFTVTFTPGTAAAKQTTLRVVTDDEDEGTFDIALTGTGNALPTLTLPTSPVLAETTVLSGTTVNFTVTANDTEDGALTPVVTPASGSNFPRGDTTVNVSATDSNGAVVNGSFVVHVQLTKPVNTPTLAKGDAAPGAGTNGLPPDAKLSTFGMPAIDDVGNVAFTAAWTSATGGKGSGLFTNTACISLVGAPVPGVSGAKYKGFSDPVIDGGRIASIITMMGVPAISSSAVLTATTSDDVEIVARAGDVATTDGAKFKSFKSVEVRGLTIAFAAKLITGTGTPKATTASDEGVWVKDLTSSLVLALRKGQSVGPRKIKTLTSFDSSTGSRGQGRGWLELTGSAATVQARVLYTDSTQAALSVRVSGGNATVNTLLHSDDVLPDGFQLSGPFGLPAENASGQSALLTSTVSDRGARPGIETNLDGKGYIRIVARDEGTPGSSNYFSTLQDPVLAEDGGVAFPAKIRGTGINGIAANTLWWQPVGGSLTLLARGGAINGGAQNDLPVGAQWSAFNSLAIAADRGPLFSASLVVGKGGVTTANSKGVWAVDYQGKLQHLFRTGETVNGKTLKSFTLLNATVGNSGVTRSFNDNAQVAWLATFTDASQAIITTNVP